MGRRGTVWGNGDEESLEWTREESTSSDLEKKDRIFDPSTRRPGAPAAVANPKALERRATRPKNPKVIINPKNAQRTATSTLATRSTVAAARQSGSVPLTMWNDNSSEFPLTSSFSPPLFGSIRSVQLWDRVDTESISEAVQARVNKGKNCY